MSLRSLLIYSLLLLPLWRRKNVGYVTMILLQIASPVIVVRWYISVVGEGKAPCLLRRERVRRGNETGISWKCSASTYYLNDSIASLTSNSSSLEMHHRLTQRVVGGAAGFVCIERIGTAGEGRRAGATRRRSRRRRRSGNLLQRHFYGQILALTPSPSQSVAFHCLLRLLRGCSRARGMNRRPSECCSVPPQHRHILAGQVCALPMLLISTLEFFYNTQSKCANAISTLLHFCIHKQIYSFLGWPASNKEIN